MSIPPGERVGPYRVAEHIGSGGMGDVYRAMDVNLKRDVALKILPTEFVTDVARLDRLRREAEILASLNHQNIAHVYGLEKSGATTALVMELVEGPTLAERIAARSLPPDEALAIALQITAALEAAHERGIVHRDLKPANVKLTRDDHVKVLDFGIAKALDPRSGAASSKALTTPAATEVGAVVGTAAYMAPEQARGKSVDERADIWAFGCVLYELLTGRAAFLGDDGSTTLARVLEREPDMSALPDSVAPNVRTTLELCLRKDVRKRIADIRDVRLALEGAFEHRAPPVMERSAQSVWRRAALAAAVLGAMMVVGIILWRQTSIPAPIASSPVTRFVVTPPGGARLTSLGGLDVVISPDGERLVFVAQHANGGVALYARELDELQARLIVGTDLPTAEQTINPFFSADGKWIGFRAPDRGLVRVPVDGGQPLQIADDPEPGFVGAAWSSDDTLIFASGRQLHRVSVGSGGVPQPFTPEPTSASAPGLVGPTLLPGERTLLVTENTGSVPRVAVLDLATGERNLLIEDAANPTYSATGHLVFGRGTTLMAATFDLARLAVTGEPVSVLQGVRHPSAGATDYALSATGTLVYVPATAEGSDGAALVWVDRDGDAVERAYGDGVSNPRDPRLSPDSRRLLLTSGPLVDADLWLYDLGGRPPVPLALQTNSHSAVWSPDGTRVAYGRFSSGASGSASGTILTMQADGAREAEELHPDILRGAPKHWSAAGELLIVDPFQGNVRSIEVEGVAQVRDVIVTDDAEYDPALSPNGRWLAYASNRSGRTEVWVKGYPEGPPVRVSSNGGYEPRWSRDGREIFYVQERSLMAVAVEAANEFSFSTPVQLFTGPYYFEPAPVAASYDVAADGRFLMIQPQPDAGDAATNPSNIVVVQNWTDELNRLVPIGR